MTYRRFKYESLFYALAFVVALALRLTQLGAMPLNDIEASAALQALRVSQSIPTALDPHPFYILSTSIAFLLYGGGTNFLARLMPALIGSLLVLAPALLDDRLKPRPSLILAFLIALDPGLVAISRQAASPIFAIAFLAFAVGFFNKNKPALAAAFAAFALLGGTPLWLGLLGIGITAAIFQLFNRQSTSDVQQPALFNFTLSTFHLPPSTFILFLLVFISAGTLFFTVPVGLGTAVSSIPAFISAWTGSSEITPGLVSLSLLVYQPLAILLAIIAIVRGWVQGLRRIIFLSIWFLIAFILTLFLPARQMADLVWALIPLNALAALELARAFNIMPIERKEVAGVTFLTVFISAFAWLGLAGMIWYPSDSREYILRFWMLIAALFLLVVSLLLIAAGWSIRTARFGGVWGMVLVLGVIGLGGALGSTGLRGSNAPELWWQTSTPAQARLLEETISQVSEFGKGNDDAVPVVIIGMDAPSLEWILREHPVQNATALDATNSPELIITPFQLDPSLVSAYRGQDFTWRQTPMWSTALAADWMRWVALREMPQAGETILLWVRSDLFLDQ